MRWKCTYTDCARNSVTNSSLTSAAWDIWWRRTDEIVTRPFAIIAGRSDSHGRRFAVCHLVPDRDASGEPAVRLSHAADGLRAAGQRRRTIRRAGGVQQL